MTDSVAAATFLSNGKALTGEEPPKSVEGERGEGDCCPVGLNLLVPCRKACIVGLGSGAGLRSFWCWDMASLRLRSRVSTFDVETDLTTEPPKPEPPRR
jgi:hypothetical protein